jgi:hypothetical protein
MKIKIRDAVTATLSGKRLSAHGNIKLTKNAREIIIEGLPTDSDGGGAAIVNNFTFDKNGMSFTSGNGKYRVGNVGVIGNVGSNNVVVGNGTVLFSNNNSFIGQQVVSGGKIINNIGGKKKTGTKDKDVNIDEEIQDSIDEIQVSSASTLNIVGKETQLSPLLEITLSGASTIHFENVVLAKLRARLSGSSSMWGSCTVSNVNVRVSGCSSCYGMHVRGDGDVEASGCSKIKMTCTDIERISQESRGLSNIIINVIPDKKEQPTDEKEKTTDVKEQATDGADKKEKRPAADESDVIVLDVSKKQKTSE